MKYRVLWFDSTLRDVKQCTKCNENRSLDEFYKRVRSSDGYAPWCKPCHAAYDRARYATIDKARKVQNMERTRDRNRAHVWQYLLDNPCVDCGETDPVVLEFDHLRDKEHHISYLITNSSVRVLQDEIDKCEVRCANCHRRITYKRADSWRNDYGI